MNKIAITNMAKRSCLTMLPIIERGNVRDDITVMKIEAISGGYSYNWDICVVWDCEEFSETRGI